MCDICTNDHCVGFDTQSMDSMIGTAVLEIDFEAMASITFFRLLQGS
jgi:hypothetical protein